MWLCLSIHLLMGNLCCFQFLSILNKCAFNINICLYMDIYFPLLGKYPGTELLCHLLNVCLILLEFVTPWLKSGCTGLAEKVIWVFPLNVIEKCECSFWSTQYLYTFPTQISESSSASMSSLTLSIKLHFIGL